MTETEGSFGILSSPCLLPVITPTTLTLLDKVFSCQMFLLYITIARNRQSSMAVPSRALKLWCSAMERVAFPAAGLQCGLLRGPHRALW